MKLPITYNKNFDNLNIELMNLYKEQFTLRMQIFSGKLNRTHLLKENRRNIARLKTLINKR